MYFIKGTFWSRRHQFVVFHTICSLFSSLIFVLSSFFSLLLSPLLAFSSMFPGFFLLRFPLFTPFRLFMLFPFVFLFPFSLLVPFSVRRIVVSGRKWLITALNYLCFFISSNTVFLSHWNIIGKANKFHFCQKLDIVC